MTIEARDHVCSTESRAIMWLSREHDSANDKRAWEDSPLDWLRAAKKVMENINTNERNDQ